MSKYLRHQSIINTNNESNDCLLKQFENNLQKSAVQPKHVDRSLFDQINNIMNTRSKYPSVEAAVEDMKERSGLTAYLNKISVSPNVITKKVATELDNTSVNDEPLVIKQCPQIKNTLQNYIKDTKGNLPISAIINKIMTIHRNDISDFSNWDDEKLLRLVSQLNLNEKRNNPSTFNQFQNLGLRDESSNSEIDSGNINAFDFATPVKF